MAKAEMSNIWPMICIQPKEPSDPWWRFFSWWQPGTWMRPVMLKSQQHYGLFLWWQPSTCDAELFPELPLGLQCQCFCQLSCLAPGWKKQCWSPSSTREEAQYHAAGFCCGSQVPGSGGMAPFFQPMGWSHWLLEWCEARWVWYLN